MKFNSRGVIGLLAIGFMLILCINRSWNIPWGFVVLSTVFVVVLTIGTKIDYELKIEPRIEIGGYISYLLCSLSLFLTFEGFWFWTAIFILCFSVGFAIPFMLFIKAR
jgi:hypothetical protein